MDTSFDLLALLKQRPVAKTHKLKPTQFVSVAGGVQKRLETNIKYRKSSRLSVFDRIRNISRCESPCKAVLSDVQQKAEHRKQQLAKWKEEKEKKKKEAAAQKKKPFVAGSAHRSTFGPAPPPRPMPSTSGRVTRSQALKQRTEQAKQLQSFAPKNAPFRPPQFKAAQLPTLAPIAKRKTDHSNLRFEPVLPKAVPKVATRATRSNATKPVAEAKVTRQQYNKPKPQPRNKVVLKPPPLKQSMFQSSSSSDMDQSVRSIPMKTSKYESSSSSSDSEHMKLQQPEKMSMFQSSSSSDIDQLQSMQTSNYQSSSSSDLDQQLSKLHDSTSLSQESVSDKSEETHRTPKSKIPKSESSSEEKLRSPKSDLQLTPEQIVEEAKNISPFVTLSRGKANARREMKKKLDEGLLDEDNSHMESVTHFRRQLESEVSRITAMCEVWDKIFAQTVLPESVQELVLTAVGQARLLASQKMQQFAALVEACAARAAGAALVTPADLHGFWDMLFMQVENVDMRFKKLEELRSREWADEPPPPRRARAGPTVPTVPNAAAKKTKPSAGPSRLREMIAAARKAKKDQESQSSGQSDSDKSETSPECKTFEAGFFRVSSPVKKPSAPATPVNKGSLLKSVLSSEARKASASKKSASFAMLRASVMSKNVDIEGVSPLLETPKQPPVDLYATPARSILKQVNPLSSKKPDKLKTVLFHDSDEEPSSSLLSFSSCAEKEAEPVEKIENIEKVEKVEKVESAGKENRLTRRQSRLSRQNASDCPSPIMTRSRRSALTPRAPASAAAASVVSAVSAAASARGTPRGDAPKRTTRRKSAAAL